MNSFKSLISVSTSIYETVLPFYYSFKFFGLASFHLNVVDGKIKMRYKDYFLLLLSILFGVVLIITLCTEINGNLKMGTPFIQKGWRYQYLYQLNIIIPIILFGSFKRKHVEKFLAIVYSFDEFIELSNWEHKVNHSNEKKRLWIWLASSTFLSMIMYIFTILTTRETTTFDV